MRDVAVGTVYHRAAKAAGCSTDLEAFVDLGRGVSLLAREQADMPVACPRAVLWLAAKVLVAKAEAVGRRAHVRLHNSGDLFAQARVDALVGINRQDPIVFRELDAGIPLTP